MILGIGCGSCFVSGRGPVDILCIGATGSGCGSQCKGGEGGSFDVGASVGEVADECLDGDLHLRVRLQGVVGVDENGGGTIRTSWPLRRVGSRGVLLESEGPRPGGQLRSREDFFGGFLRSFSLVQVCKSFTSG